jgi:hypothetical protein
MDALVPTSPVEKHINLLKRGEVEESGVAS